MENLYEIFDLKLRNVPTTFTRFMMERINWSHRLISIQGARGAGKTTLILQYIKQKFQRPSKIVLYVDLENIYFATNSILELADRFYKLGGKYLFLDEIHKYPSWSSEIKQIYDTYRDLNVVITGSSILEIKKGEADLSRRLVSYSLPGLSFREFLLLNDVANIEKFTLEDLLDDHMGIAHQLTNRIRPLEYFMDYLRYGYYPYFIEGRDVYPEKLLKTVNLILESDLPASIGIDYNSILKLKKLLSIIASSVPFKPNTQKLAYQTEVTRPTLLRFFHLLERTRLLSALQSSTKGVQKMAKPDKLYLENTNLMFALASENANVGTLRETFFHNQVKEVYKIELPNKGDFLVDDQFVFEVGGKTKGSKQIRDEESSFIAKDDIETGYGKTIPLWLFGFLY